MSKRNKGNRSKQVNHHKTQSRQHFNTDRIVRPLLKALGQCHDVKIACKLMEELHRALFRDHDNMGGITISLDDESIDDLPVQSGRDASAKIVSLAVAKSILECHGFAVLLVALQHFAAQATAVTCWACRIFTTVTGVIPLASRHLLELGGLRTMLQALKSPITSYNTYSNVGKAASITMRLEYILKGNMVGLLHNLIVNAEYQSHGKEAATKRCLEFVISVLETYPANAHVQEWGIRYLVAAGQTQDSRVNAFLYKKRVGNLFVTALEHFREDDSHVKRVARKAMKWYASS